MPGPGWRPQPGWRGHSQAARAVPGRRRGRRRTQRPERGRARGRGGGRAAARDPPAPSRHRPRRRARPRRARDDPQAARRRRGGERTRHGRSPRPSGPSRGAPPGRAPPVEVTQPWARSSSMTVGATTCAAKTRPPISPRPRTAFRARARARKPTAVGPRARLGRAAPRGRRSSSRPNRHVARGGGGAAALSPPPAPPRRAGCQEPRRSDPTSSNPECG